MRADKVAFRNERRLAAMGHAAASQEEFISDFHQLSRALAELEEERDRAISSVFTDGKRDAYKKHCAMVKERLLSIERDTSDTSGKLESRRHILKEAKQTLIDQAIDIEKFKEIRREIANRTWSAFEQHFRRGERQDSTAEVNEAAFRARATPSSWLISAPYIHASTGGGALNVVNNQEVNEVGLESANVKGELLVWDTNWMNEPSTINNEYHAAYYRNFALVYVPFTMPAYAGRIAVIVDLVAKGEVKFEHERKDISGFWGAADSSVAHTCEVYYIVVENDDRSYDFIYDHGPSRSDQDETVSSTVLPVGMSVRRILYSNGVYQPGQVVTLAVGIRNLDRFWANDMWFKTHMWSDWSVQAVEPVGVP